MIDINEFEVGSCFLYPEHETFLRLLFRFHSSESCFFSEFEVDENDHLVSTSLEYLTLNFDDCSRLVPVVNMEVLNG